MISNKKLQEFKALYRKHFGIELSDGEAQEKGSKLVRLLEIVYKPMTQEEYNEVTKRKEEIMKTDELAQEAVDNLNRNVEESVARGERYDKIYAIERTKWPHGMGSVKDRYEIPENLQAELDECITRSQNIAREACQTEELTNAYLAENA